jgi:hypothetical protein
MMVIAKPESFFYSLLLFVTLLPPTANASPPVPHPVDGFTCRLDTDAGAPSGSPEFVDPYGHSGRPYCPTNYILEELEKPDPYDFGPMTIIQESTDPERTPEVEAAIEIAPLAPPETQEKCPPDETGCEEDEKLN